MRSATTSELAVLAGLTRTVTKRVKIANGSGTMIDLSSWAEHVSPDEDIDQPVSGLTVEFTRANGVLQTLAPLRTDSTLNVKDDLTYAPQVDLVRRVTYEVATTASGVLPVADDYKLLFDGTTSVVNFAGSPIVVTCRDKGAVLVDRFVETPKRYGSDPGVAVETVMQSIHDDVLGVGVVPVYTPAPPGYLITPAYQQQIQSVMDADVALAQNPGWDVRYRWDNGTSAFRFTFKEPGRAKTVPDHTFGPSGYFDVTKLELAETDIRNVVIVSFRDSADLGNRKTIAVTDGPSITKYGRKPLVIIEGDSSPINTVAEATTMANAALADMKDPKADMELTLPFFWPCELGDLYRFSANGVHFNTDQDLAVVSFTHDLGPSQHETRIRVRGTPAGQYLTWLGRGETIGGPGGGAVAKPPYPYISPRGTELDDLTWDLRFNALNGSGGGGTNLEYTIKLKKSFGAESTLDSGNASVFPKDLTVTRDPKQNAVLAFRVTDAATGLFAEATWNIPAYSPYVNSTGNVNRDRPFHDGGYAGQAVDSSGYQLDSSVTQQSGGTSRNLAVGRYTLLTGTHAQSVTFPTNYQYPPAVTIAGGISYQPASLWGTAANADAQPQTGTLAPLTAAQIDELVAYNVTTSGCTLRGRLRQSSTSTDRSNAFATGAITTDGGNKEATTANAPATSDSYAAGYTYSFQVSGVPGKTGGISATVCFDYWNGSSWIQVASATYADSDTDGDGSVIISGTDSLPAFISGLTTTSTVRIRLVVNPSAGGGTKTYSVDPDFCTYVTTTGDQYTSKTPAGLGITLAVEVIGAS